MENTQTMIIDGRSYAIQGEKNVLQLCRNHGIDIPSLCYHPSLSVFAGCRLCLVECEGVGIVSSCTLAPRDGMVVRTNTTTIRNLRKTTLQLILADHDVDCTSCPKSGKCRLQELALRYNLRESLYKKVRFKSERDLSSVSIVRDPSKCILCGNCVRACSEIQGISVLGFIKSGNGLKVRPVSGRPIGKVDCVGCGQCAAVCPVGAIYSHSYNEAIWKAIDDPNKIVVAQIAPAVRVSMGEEFGMKPGSNVLGKIVAAMRQIGFDAVYDTAFCAEFTTVGDGSELLDRLKKDEGLPVFTSCCPAWVKYAEEYEQDMLDHLSSCKPPQEMGAALFRKVLPAKFGKENKDIVVVSIMPCTAKKFEVNREEFSQEGVQDINYAVTTTELADMIKEAGIDFNSLEGEACDDPFGHEAGAGVIYGVTGGVTESVLRFISEKLTGERPADLKFEAVRGNHAIREATLTIGEFTLNLCQVFGLKNAKKVCKDIRTGAKKYHFVEVMACPHGCINGGGQPFTLRPDVVVPARAAGIYDHEVELDHRTPLDDQALADLFKLVLGGDPSSQEAQELLHTTYHARPKFVD